MTAATDIIDRMSGRRDSDLTDLTELRTLIGDTTTVDQLRQQVTTLTEEARALRTEIGNLENANEGLLETLSLRDATIIARNAEITDLKRQLAAAAVEIARLNSIIDQLQNGGGDPGDWRVDTWLGATINARGSQSYAQAVAEWESTRGRIGVLRTFNSGLPTTFNNSNGAPQMRNRHRIISVKGEPTAAYWDNYIKSIPVEKVSGSNEDAITGLVINHEPENDGGSMTPAVFRRRCDLMQARIEASGRTDIIAGLVLMSWLELDNNPGTTSSDWFPTNPGKFFLFLDPYDPNGIKTGKAQTEASLALWRSKGGVWWGVTETGAHRTGDDLARWITDYARWCHDEGASFFIWFHSAVGANAGPTGWWLDDPKGIAAWKALAPVIRAA